MDPKRKKIYIIIIVLCFSATAGLLVWNFGPTSSDRQPLPPNTELTTPVEQSQAIGSSAIRLTVPAVFPATDKFNTQVLQSDRFLKLEPYTPVDVTGQLGRSDPFRSF